MDRIPTSSLSLREAIIVATICFGLFIVWSTQAVLAGFPTAEFSDADNVVGIGLEVVLGGCALWYLHGRKFDNRSLYPRPQWSGALQGTALYAAALLFGWIATEPFTGQGGEPAMVAFSFRNVSLASTVAFAMVNGVYEEVFLLGVLLRGLKGHGVVFAAGFSMLVRLLYHLYQGPAGVVSVLVFGLVLTVFYVRTGRLWPVVFAHILGDIVPVVWSDA